MDTKLTSFRDHLIILYKQAWLDLWDCEPPIVQRRGRNSVVIVSDHGRHVLSAKRLLGRINHMRNWAAQQGGDA